LAAGSASQGSSKCHNSSPPLNLSDPFLGSTPKPGPLHAQLAPIEEEESIDDLRRLWSLPPPPFCYGLTKATKTFSANDEISHVLDPFGSGISYYDLICLLTKCDDCHMIMTPCTIPDHDCMVTITASGRQKKKVWNLGNARSTAKARLAAEMKEKGIVKGRRTSKTKVTTSKRAPSPAISISSTSD